MSDRWTDRLSDYLDDELTAGERADLEAHLPACPSCTAALAELRRVVARARSLEATAPAHDLWPGIADRIGTVRPLGRARRGWTFTLPQLAAAGIALMIASGGAAWLLHPDGPPAVAAAPTPGAGPGFTALPAGDRRRTGTQGYDAAVADLEGVLEAGRGRLDTTTVRVIEKNLATIDSAIAQAQRAVAADSSNLYLNAHLADTRRRKLELLRQAAVLVNSVS